MDYVEVKVKYSPASETASDLMAAFLADMGYESFVADEEGLTAYIVASQYSADDLEEMLQSFPMEIKYEVTDTFIEGQDWNEEWEKNYFQPILIDDQCVVHSTFHKDIPESEYDIVIDPKMAFGTGHHATTSMMLRHILSLDMEGKSVIDMGTGTGILAILAKMKGADKSTGIEIDPDAAVNARENVKLNNVDVNIITGDSSQLESLGQADYFIANINRNVILADLSRYVSALKPGGMMILSGFYSEDVPLLERAAAMYGLHTDCVLTEDDNWTSLRLIKD
ncbi:MAG: 50S ribosomal protein L11 methyltransferase [Muribaculaceae bacterium]|nr:50S ribosomal protein L11 methyltransferase [Muribaculaceae bacterium]